MTHERSADERAHRELEAIWREAERCQRARAVGTSRRVGRAYGGAGEPVSDHVYARAGARSPNRFSRRVVRRVAADDLEAAAEAMEDLRADAAERELEARRLHEQADVDADHAAHEKRLQEIETRAAADVAAGEERLRRELAAQEEAERKAQAEALARALRRP